MMIKYLQTIFKVGDPIQINGTSGQVAGVIELFAEDFIVIKKEDGTITGIKEDGISSFSTIEQPSYQPHGRGTHQAQYTEQKEHSDRSTRNERTTYQPTSHERGQDNFKQNRYNYARPLKEDVQRTLQKRPFKEFKPGEKIPLEVLKHRDPTLASNWRRREEARAFSKEILNAISTTIDETIEAQRNEDTIILPGMGAIVELQPSFPFGFIDDLQTGERYYFNRSDIIDPELLAHSGEEIEVIYSRTTNHKGRAARAIHQPKTIHEIVKLVQHLVSNDDLGRAKQVLENILTFLPSNHSVKAVYTAIDTALQRQESNAPRRIELDEGEAAYHAARVHLSRKEYKEALDYYYKALAKSERKSNCIKEIAQVYISMHSQESDETRKAEIRERGLKFIEEHKKLLPDQHNTLFSLENIYFALGDYKKHKGITYEIIKDSYEQEDWGRYVFYQNKMAQSYLRTNQLEEGLEAAEAGLEIEPNNAHLLKTKATIEEAMGLERYEDSATDSDIDNDDPTLHARYSKYY